MVLQWHRRMSRRTRAIFVALVAIFFLLSIALLHCGLLGIDRSSPSAPLCAFPELQDERSSNFGFPFWRTNNTVRALTLYESRWIRFEDHTVRIGKKKSRALHRASQQQREEVKTRDDGRVGEEDEPMVVSGWKWFDVPDQVNVIVSVTWRVGKSQFPDALVECSSQEKLLASRPRCSQRVRDDDLAGEGEEEEYFVLFRQRKYGYHGDSYAVVGGVMEPSDSASPQRAAEREVKEELSLGSCDSWASFGSYRTDVNRGGGFVNLFFARRCRPLAESVAAVGIDDLEDQAVFLVTRGRLMEIALTSGAVKEVKWAAMVALTLLHTHSKD
jgi:8-oxo-dGTP pyrophosphatase MutT (NUDIX family)